MMCGTCLQLTGCNSCHLFQAVTCQTSAVLDHLLFFEVCSIFLDLSSACFGELTCGYDVRYLSATHWLQFVQFMSGSDLANLCGIAQFTVFGNLFDFC